MRRKPSLGLIILVTGLAIVVTFWLTRDPAPVNGDSPTAFVVEPRDLPIVLQEKGELKAKNSVEIKCEIEGRTRILFLVPEGSVVKKGDLLVELASDQIEEKLRAERLKETAAIAASEAATKEYEIQLDQNASDIRKGELAVRIAELNKNKYEEGDWEQAKQEARLNLERAQEELRRATEKLADSEKLAAKNFISQLDLDDDKFRAYEAQISLQKAELALEILQKYTHEVDRARVESDWEEAKKELERIRKSADANEAKKKANKEGKQTELDYIQQEIKKYEGQLANCKIYAPSAGFVVYYNEDHRWGGETQIREGVEVHERQSILTIPDPAVMTAILRIHEAKVDKVQVGQKALVEVEGVPGETFTGQITKIARLADSRNRWLNQDLKEYETEVTLDPAEVELKPGATARVQIMVDHLEDVLAVPVQSIYSKAGQSFVFLDKGDDYGEPVPVRLGASNAEYVEVREGLKSGTAVLLAISEEMKRLIPDVAPPELEMPARLEPRRAGGPAVPAG
ncbi:MAG: efflux RND transporter periplasmic adaptor subunit [Phycisphaerales bacterium]|nr:MAG: efflux RND transporter periplasmic adaptor subunit [Phycisphaerales bacterium]